ncbi:MAG: hypothetical protein Q3965_05090 [Rothia sp. (in: high G+C Gram-positive bacteria)]|nr:hypothetical protein [Rothia sp. (in: high G+C Gram-positive bacteria)]
MTIIGTMVGAVVDGTNGAGGFALGTGIVYLSFIISIGIVLVGERRSMVTAAKSLVLAYVIKVAVLAPLLVLAPVPDGYRNGWMLLAAVLAVLAQLTVEVKAISLQRLLYFDSAR